MISAKDLSYYEHFMKANFLPELSSYFPLLNEGAVFLNCELSSLSKLPSEHPVRQHMNCSVPRSRVSHQRVARMIKGLGLESLTPVRLKNAFLEQVLNGSYFTWEVWKSGHLRLGVPWKPRNESTGRVSLNLIATQIVTIQFEVQEISENQFQLFFGSSDTDFDRMFSLTRTRVDETKKDRLVGTKMVIGFKQIGDDLLFAAQTFCIDTFPILDFIFKPVIHRTFHEHVYTATYFNEFLRDFQEQDVTAEEVPLQGGSFQTRI